MASNDPRAYEAAALKCFIDVFGSEAIVKRCRFCRVALLGIALVCGVSVYLAYNYTHIQIPILFIVAALGGALASTAGTYSASARNNEILAAYVDLDAMRRRREELLTQPENGWK